MNRRELLIGAAAVGAAAALPSGISLPAAVIPQPVTITTTMLDALMAQARLAESQSCSIIWLRIWHDGETLLSSPITVDEFWKPA